MDVGQEWPTYKKICSFPGSAWERNALQAPPAETESGGGASKTVCSQAEPGNKGQGKVEIRRDAASENGTSSEYEMNRQAGLGGT
ncbi:hypothetical protein RISK_005756 [Rhodopirellula islandica]|uniref:Uncharacterized protein n=1 Tax=Rhodopirellula islandica TaxID=595434 RepID=A0A0J1B793_RHOIS|nr:hypothetical protein RISK_005756 [Rhodopirellula islandica]